MLTLLVSVVLENLKAFVISPRVEGDQLKIDPLLVLIAVLVGAALLGAGGALVAVPFAAMLQVLFDEVFVPWRARADRGGGAGRAARTVGLNARLSSIAALPAVSRSGTSRSSQLRPNATSMTVAAVRKTGWSAAL